MISKKKASASEETFKQFSQILMGKQDKMKTELLAHAKTKVEKFKSFRADLDKDIRVINNVIKRVRKKVHDQVRSELNPEGLLAREELAYQKCLSFQ